MMIMTLPPFWMLLLAHVPLGYRRSPRRIRCKETLAALPFLPSARGKSRRVPSHDLPLWAPVVLGVPRQLPVRQLALREIGPGLVGRNRRRHRGKRGCALLYTGHLQNLHPFSSSFFLLSGALRSCKCYVSLTIILSFLLHATLLVLLLHTLFRCSAWRLQLEWCPSALAHLSRPRSQPSPQLPGL